MEKAIIKVKDLGYDALKEAYRRLLDVAEAIGIKEPPKDPLVIVSYLKKYFPELTLDEVIDAFLRNTAGTLVETVKHFGDFDLTFIGGVLRSYKETVRRERQEARVRKPEERSDRLITNDVPQKVKDRRVLIAALQYVRANKRIPITWDWVGSARALKSSGRLCLSEKEAGELLSEAIKEEEALINRSAIMGTILQSEAIRNVERLQADLDYQDFIACRLYVKKYLSRYI